jgi:flagellar basal body-associated protein FliL
MASEKPAAAPAPAADKDGAPAKKGGMKVIIVAAAVVLLEVGTVFITLKASGGPKRVIADPVPTEPVKKVEKDVEVKVFEAASLPNKQSGRLALYKFQVVAKVAETKKKEVTALFEEKDFEIRDQMRTIIASSVEEELNEPGLETLRRKVLFQLEQDIGKDMIKEVLIPVCWGNYNN